MMAGMNQGASNVETVDEIMDPQIFEKSKQHLSLKGSD